MSTVNKSIADRYVGASLCLHKLASNFLIGAIDKEEKEETEFGHCAIRLTVSRNESTKTTEPSAVGRVQCQGERRKGQLDCAFADSPRAPGECSVRHCHVLRLEPSATNRLTGSLDSLTIAAFPPLRPLPSPDWFALAVPAPGRFTLAKADRHS